MGQRGAVTVSMLERLHNLEAALDARAAERLQDYVRTGGGLLLALGGQRGLLALDRAAQCLNPPLALAGGRLFGARLRGGRFRLAGPGAGPRPGQ